MVWFYPTYHERYCTSTCNKVRERRKWQNHFRRLFFFDYKDNCCFFTWTCKKSRQICLHWLLQGKRNKYISRFIKFDQFCTGQIVVKIFCEIRNCAKYWKKDRFQGVYALKTVDFWSKWQDSNLQHPGPKPGALPIALHLDGEKTYEIVVLTELVKIVVKPLLRG